jgi:hypothetical protein
MALTDGLIAKYDLDTNANDSVGTNHGAVSGATQVVDGAGYTFDGTNDYIQIANDAALNSNTGTISAWVNFSVNPLGSSSTGSPYLHMSVVSKTDVSSSKNGWNLFIANSTPRIQIKNATSQTMIQSSGAALNDGSWHHIVVTFESGGTTKMFVDNVEVASQSTISFNVSSQPLRIGTSVDSYWDTFNGSVKDVRLWNRTISATEVEELYNGNTLIPQGTKYDNTNNPEIISSNAPSGAMGIEKTSGDNGFFVYSQKPYTLWFKDSLGTWSIHQAFTSENLVNGSSFRWGTNQAAYLQTGESSHTVYLYGRTGALLIDSTPSDGNNVVDALVLDDASTLKILGSSNTATTTESTHTISDGSPVTIADGCDASVVVKEVVSDYTDSLSSKLLAYYKFEDNADDSGVSGLHGTASAGCNYVTGKSGMGNALHQTTADAHVALRNSEVLNLGPDFTVAAWIYVPSVQAATDPVDNPWNDVSVFANADSFGNWTYVAGINLSVSKPGYSSGWGLHSNALALYTGCGQGNGIYSWAYYAVSTPANSFPYDEWVHVAVTFAGSDQAGWGGNEKLYINGQVQVLSSRTNQPVQNPMEWTSNVLAANLGAGWRASQPEAMGGSGEIKYDEVAIWKRELSESEIADLYNSSNGQELDTSYATTETVRNDFTVEKAVTVTAPAGTDTTNIKVEITK